MRKGEGPRSDALGASSAAASRPAAPITRQGDVLPKPSGVQEDSDEDETLASRRDRICQRSSQCDHRKGSTKGRAGGSNKRGPSAPLAAPNPKSQRSAPAASAAPAAPAAAGKVEDVHLDAISAPSGGNGMPAAGHSDAADHGPVHEYLKLPSFQRVVEAHTALKQAQERQAQAASKAQVLREEERAALADAEEARARIASFAEGTAAYHAARAAALSKHAEAEKLKALASQAQGPAQAASCEAQDALEQLQSHISTFRSEESSAAQEPKKAGNQLAKQQAKVSLCKEEEEEAKRAYEAKRAATAAAEEQVVVYAQQVTEAEQQARLYKEALAKVDTYQQACVEAAAADVHQGRQLTVWQAGGGGQEEQQKRPNAGAHIATCDGHDYTPAAPASGTGLVPAGAAPAPYPPASTAIIPANAPAPTSPPTSSAKRSWTERWWKPREQQGGRS